MICKIAKRQRDYVQIRNLTLRDSRLSMNATAVLAFLLSYPEDWEVRMSQICSRFNSSKRTISRVFKELSQLSYAALRPIPGGNGKWKGSQYIIYEKPKDPTSETPFHRHSTKRRLSLLRKDKKTYSSASECAGESFFGLNGDTSPFIKHACDKLEDYVRRERKLDKRFNRKTWYEDMRLLLQDIQGDKLRLKRVLQGYISISADKWKPDVACARSFRDKFLKIEKWLESFEEDKEYGPTITARCINPNHKSRYSSE